MRRTFRLMVVIAALLAGFFADDLIGYFQADPPPKDLSRYCALSTQRCDQNGVGMTLAHDTAHPLVATPLEVDWPNAAQDTLLLTLEGLEMDMGQTKFVLKRRDDGRFGADLMLPVCTTAHMTWVGTLTDGHTTVYPAIRMQR